MHELYLNITASK